jgi:hypothetical protein
LDADEIQQGTHHLSYQYGRATKAVSLIPPAYYADLACERGRYYLNEFLNLGDNASATERSGSETRDEAEARVYANAKARWGGGLHPDLRESMFYI